MKMPSKRRKELLIAATAAFLAIAVTLPFVIDYVSISRRHHVPLPPGNIATPNERSIRWNDESELTRKVLTYWADRPLGDWKSEGKIKAPRTLLARLMLGVDLAATNDYLLSQEPWGNVGSTWPGNPNGDYDFTLAGLIPILYLFGDDPDVLYPQTRDHLVKKLIPIDGGEPLRMVPRTAGLVPDTENHLLMTEGSRYLKNRWLMLHGDSSATYDNIANGLEEWLLGFIEELRSAGLYEFNSIPYEGYTLTALLNLEAFGSTEVQSAARRVLDQLNWNYAVGSLRFRRFPPFRRQYAHASDTSLMGDRHVGLIKPWISLLPERPENLKLKGNQHIAIWACWSPYRLPDRTARWILEKPTDYFIRIGHGADSSPEIYSGGPGYLLSAGGVNRGPRSLIVARPITLCLDDGANDLPGVVHLSGPGKDFRQWNNTGVWRNTAVAAGPVHLPSKWEASAESRLWKVFQREANLCVGVHSQTDLGVVHVVRSENAEQVLDSLDKSNANKETLRSAFQIPNGPRLVYDVDAPKNRWVIQRVNDQIIDRNFDAWPAMSGTTDSPVTPRDDP
ncbi:hypothetical protein FHS27_004678 [Rhodopirellula rubra]|uniref:Uncharacterized protein n=1 Tax=Aporhodopirellula rubra TaxID=980271 RepID=A0A7W5E2D1_9BACT|nr:hypothetical protein [Aporhodopirellula rubra]MBB3208845.1 hypothetical protein [Aporhodopirellula rubra]